MFVTLGIINCQDVDSVLFLLRTNAAVVLFLDARIGYCSSEISKYFHH